MREIIGQGIIIVVVFFICSLINFVYLKVKKLETRVENLEKILAEYSIAKLKSAFDIFQDLVREQKEDALKDRGEK